MCQVMKGASITLFVLTFFCVVICSCDEISISFGRNSEAVELLYNRSWVDFYDEDASTECRRELYFYPDGGGRIYYDYYDIYSGELKDAFSEYFYWDWNIYGSSINMEFSDGYGYFDDIMISGNYLSGILDGYKVTFTDGYLLN